jgi:DNA-binding NarL/FixJ family response regulator
MTETVETRVVLADHPGAARTALARLVSETPGVALVANLSRPEDIEPAVQTWQPDVVVVDDRLLRHSRWTRDELGVRLIVVGVDDDPGFRLRARRIGADAWIAKDRADALLPLRLGGEAAAQAAESATAGGSASG